MYLCKSAEAVAIAQIDWLQDMALILAMGAYVSRVLHCLLGGLISYSQAVSLFVVGDLERSDYAARGQAEAESV